MCEAKDFPPSERDELMGLVTQLQGQVAQLTAANEELHKQVAELKRAGKRQAAPFSKGGRSSQFDRGVIAAQVPLEKHKHSLSLRSGPQ